MILEERASEKRQHGENEVCMTSDANSQRKMRSTYLIRILTELECEGVLVEFRVDPCAASPADNVPVRVKPVPVANTSIRRKERCTT